MDDNVLKFSPLFVMFLHQNCSNEYVPLFSYDRANQMDFLSKFSASIEAHECGWTEKVYPSTYTIHLMNLAVRHELWLNKIP